MSASHLDPRRCKRCKKIPRGEGAKAQAAHYAPFCSYSCQEWHRLEVAQQYVAELRATGSQP